MNFIDEELAPRSVNTLILFVCDKDYNYQFESYPQLGDSSALSKADVKKMVACCKKNNIMIIPQINLLGHQSWRERPNILLEKLPQFDETPNIKISVKYVWSGTSQFIDAFYGKKSANAGGRANPADGFKALFRVMDELEKEN